MCRAWFEKLQSLPVLKTGLESWYDSTINLQGVDLEFCRSTARSVQAFRSGRAPPDISWKILSQRHLGQQPFLVGDNLVWIAESLRQVNMVNLRSMTPQTLVDPSRGEINQLYAADDLVVFSVRSRGLIITSEVNGPGLVKRFRIQSPAARSALALTCRYRTLACAMHLEDRTVVYIWDYDTTRCRSFEIDRAALQTPMSNTMGHGLFLQPSTETVILCQLSEGVPTGTGPTTLLHWRFSYAGECLHGAEEVLERYDQGNQFPSREPSPRFTFVPVSYDGLYMIQCTQSIGATPVRSLQYDERVHTFTSSQCPGLYPVNTRHRGDIFWWKDVFVETGVQDEIVVHKSTDAAPHIDSGTACGQQERTTEDLLINDRYIVRPFDGSFYVFCYDHTVQLPGTTGSLPGVGSWEVIENRFPRAGECRQASRVY